MFEEYAINTHLLKWSVSMALFLDCLQLYGTASDAISSSLHYSVDSTCLSCTIMDLSYFHLVC